MGTTKWDPIVIHDVVTGLTKAANDIEGELSGAAGDVTSTLDYDNWHDDARPVYDEQRGIWEKAADGMYKVLNEGAIPTLHNMGSNLDGTEHTNKLTWNSVYD